MKCDYLVVGSGLTGATIARLLYDSGKDVVVLERREHLGGNVYDEVHPSGIRIHKYGPHYFRTDSEVIWRFINRFARFYKYEAIVKTLVDGKYENWPVTANYIHRAVGRKWEPEFKGCPKNFEQASLSMMPRLVYEKFVKGYTEKQWGVPASTLSADLAGRFEVRLNDDPRLKKQRYQGIPLEGCSSLMRNMLAEIPIIFNCDYLEMPDAFQVRKCLIFTGPIDEFFGYDMGKLEYRGQQRENIYLPNTQFVQPCAQVNNPDPVEGPHIRTLEWKHIMPSQYADRIQGTVLTRETPVSPSDPDQYEYPFPDPGNRMLYRKYRERADEISSLLICGRLGEYRYYDMDQAIERAMELANQLLAKGK
jgi:UDP-galactopyranose mutase